MEHAPPRGGARPNRLAALAVGTGAAGTVLLAATSSTVAAARAPGADVAALVAALALAGGWLLVARLVLLVLAACAALLPGAVGRAAASAAVRLAPSLLRRAVVVAVGATTVLPAVTSPALAGTPPPELPRLDRVVTWSGPTPAAVPARPRRPPAPLPPTATDDRMDSPTEGTVAVRPGDTLWGIAASHLPPRHSPADVARAWPRWYARNRAVVGPDPALLHPGERLVAPTPSAAEP